MADRRCIQYRYGTERKLGGVFRFCQQLSGLHQRGQRHGEEKAGAGAYGDEVRCSTEYRYQRCHAGFIERRYSDQLALFSAKQQSCAG